LLALYIHWPFCKSKCPYCDFNSHVAAGIDYARFASAFERELSFFAEYLKDKTITSVFFGGGTPSLMPPFIVERVLAKLRELAVLSDNCEITLEANPTSVESETFPAFVEAGVNRFSLGIQSLRPEALKFLGREHNAEEAKTAIARAKASGVRYSFDLIYARPEQTILNWQEELEEALALAGGHLSLYQLTIEKGTPFYRLYQDKAFTMPDEELSAEFYETTNSIMAGQGYAAYEVSNYARPGHICQHNMAYWRYQDYLGIGAGAHSRITKDGQHHALMMWHAPGKWLESVETLGNGLQTDTPLSSEEVREERLLMGLRTEEGVPSELITDARLVPYLNEGLLERSNERIRATAKGRLLLNRLVAGLS
jgi:putative oxygen-independent coproporphyrinogen III oxidase